MRRRSLEALCRRQYTAKETLTRGSHSIQQKVGAAVRLSQEPSDEDQYWQNSTICVDDQCAAVQEKERWDTRGLAANNDHEGLSGPRRDGVPQTRRQNTFQRNTVVNRRFTRSAHKVVSRREEDAYSRVQPAGGDSSYVPFHRVLMQN